VVFSTPGSDSLPSIMTAVTARGWGSSLLIKGMSAPAPVHRSLRELFFVQAGRPRPPARPDSRELAALAGAVRHDLSLYQRHGERVRYATEI
jgi:hypothetical protein